MKSAMALFLVKIIIFVIAKLCIYADARFLCDKHSVPCGCSFSNVEMSTRFTNSEEAVPYSWSMVVSLQYDCHRDGNPMTHCCSGTILSESYVLTSAQCVDRIDRSSILSGNVFVLAGIHNHSQQHRTIRVIDEIHIHPNWKRTAGGLPNDIAILHLTESFDFGQDIFIARTCRPPRLNSSSEYMQYPGDDTLLALVGWNSIQNSGVMTSQVLRQVSIYSVNHKHLAYAVSSNNTETQFCAGLPKDGIGESGSPAFQWIGDRWEQVGIMSSSILNYLVDNNEYVFTRIAPYHEWIESIIDRNNKQRKGTQMKATPLTSPLFTQYPTHYRCDSTTVSCGCGREQVQLSSSRIFGGENAIAGSWSMVASLRFNGTNQHACGGSILNNFFILTAAHCVDKLPATSPTGVTVAAGIHRREEGGIDIMEVDKIYVHPDWVGSSDGYQNDIAILHLSESLNIETNPFIKRTCVPYWNDSIDVAQYPPNGQSLAVIGWGAMQQQTNNLSDFLQQAKVFVIDNEDPKCKLTLKDKKTQFCAGLYSGARDTCPGDSGGPIFEWKGKWWEQVGITSYRSGCGLADRPSVYTRLAFYFDWMEEVINESLTTTTIRPPITNPPVTYHCDKTIPCGCGYNDVVLPPSRIVGGYDALPYSWPMVVSLRRLADNQHICGGSILSDSFILTAAHCVMNRPTTAPTNLFVAVGSNKQSDFTQIPNEVDHIYIHPEWIPGQLGNWNDIAILHVSQPLNLSTNQFIKRTCLQRINSSMNMLNYPLNGTRLAAIGWGLLKDDIISTTPEDLQQVELFVIDKRDDSCDKSIKDKARQFCAGIPGEGGKDTCRGDSGGPILEWKGNRWEQVGIVSYGLVCANPRTPTVFTQVANYIDWMEKVINESLTIATMFPSTTTVSSSSATVSFPGTIHLLYYFVHLIFVFVIHSLI